ncbi:hypothetical protein PILCRDRAFT_798107 [Piloderma croceum F 1598]|uniref:Integrase zinc-binding domain-containing protein n=1 Tax=Piloderma croceum (strain F 1598) TaxID=765440 RepID=A0A0C3EUG0_PILCF|nr:hypothetical protein PILCRDRAFT_798107 [Piloderma croceum F 1598]
MQQRDKFDVYYQGNLSVVDFLRRLQDLADTVGDLDDTDVVLAFWRRCKPYLKAELTRAGYEPSELTSSELEVLATRIERADEVAHETRKVASSKPMQSCGNGSNVNNGSSSTNSSRHPMNKPNNFKRPRRDYPDQDKEPMSATELKLAALSEGKEMGLFVLGNESHLLEHEPAEHSHEFQSSLRDVLWARALSQLYDNVPLAFDLLEGYCTDPFSPDRFTIIEYGGFDTYLLVDDHTLVSYIITRDQLTDPEFDLIHWFHIQQSENFHDMRRAPWWDSEGGSNHCTFQEDWHAFLERCSDSSSCEDESSSTSECLDTEVSTTFEYLNAVDEYDDLPDLQSVTDSNFGDDRSHDFEEDEFADMPDLETIYDTDDENGTHLQPVHGDLDDEPYFQTDNYHRDDDGAAGGSSFPTDESLDSSEGESIEWHKPAAMRQRPVPFVRRGFLLSAVQNAKNHTGKTEPDIYMLERNAARVKSADHVCPKPVVVVLKVKLEVLDKPLPLQLAVSGSRGKVKVRTNVRFEYQKINETRTFDIINVDSYDLILGTPFLFQHQILLGFNPSQVNVRSTESLPIRGTQVLVLESRATEVVTDHIESLREELRQYALPICKEAIETPLPPLRVINHVIPLNDEHKVYSWRPSRCPEQLKPLWRAKREDYLHTGRWEFRSGRNAVPMLMLKKPSKDGILRLRTVVDTRERNKNSRRLASPLPDIETILRNVTSHKFRTLLDALSFIGSVGYLASGCMDVRIPMHPIQRVAAPTTIWRWTPTEARAFAAIKEIVHKWRNTRRKSIDYSPDAPPCNLCCDASLTGGSGVLSQDPDAPPQVEFELENIEAPSEDVNHSLTADLSNETKPVSSLLADHGSSSQLPDDNTAAAELLSEDPVSLTEVLDSGEPTLDIHNHIHGRYSEDPFFAKIVKDPTTFRNFEVSNELVFLKDNERRVLCIPNVMIGSRRLCEVLISHAHSILAHLGPRKTITYLRDNVWWKGLNSDVDAFCDSCSGTDTLFELTWKSGDRTWLPYHEISHLEALTQYFKALGVTNISQLPRHIVKDNNLPISGISPTNHKVLKNLVSEVINSSRKLTTPNGNANQGTDKVQGSTYKDQYENLARYTAFAELIKSGQYVPRLHPIPDGYLEYCMEYQHYPAQALPFPPETDLDIVIIEGHKTRFVRRPTPVRSTQDLDDAAREDQNEPISQRTGRGRTRGDDIGRGQRRRGRGRGRGCGYAHMDESRATRALIDVFETETQYSEPEQAFPRYCASDLSTERERLHLTLALKEQVQVDLTTQVSLQLRSPFLHLSLRLKILPYLQPPRMMEKWKLMTL